MKYLMVLIILPLCLSCGYGGKTVHEKNGQSKEDTLEKKVMPADERIGCNDTLGISLYPEYSFNPLDTKFIKFVLCNNSKKEIRFGERSRITYQDEKGIWRKLPLPANICIPDILYIMQPGESRFISGYLYTDLQPNRVGRYRFFKELIHDGNQITLMSEFRLTDNKQELNNAVRYVPFFVSLEPDKIDVVEK